MCYALPTSPRFSVQRLQPPLHATTPRHDPRELPSREAAIGGAFNLPSPNELIDALVRNAQCVGEVGDRKPVNRAHKVEISLEMGTCASPGFLLNSDA